MKPNMLNVIEVNRRNATIHTGCAISYGTNTRAVIRISVPSITDFEAAAPTYPITTSTNDTGADNSS